MVFEQFYFLFQVLIQKYGTMVENYVPRSGRGSVDGMNVQMKSPALQGRNVFCFNLHKRRTFNARVVNQT